MNAAENDEFCVLLLSSPVCEFEGITPEIGKSNDFIPLIVMTKNYKSAGKPGANLADALVRLRIGQLAEAFRQQRLHHTKLQSYHAAYGAGLCRFE
jgi:hypothetical protein